MKLIINCGVCPYILYGLDIITQVDLSYDRYSCLPDDQHSILTLSSGMQYKKNRAEATLDIHIDIVIY